VTEQQWMTCDKPRLMLAHMRGPLTSEDTGGAQYGPVIRAGRLNSRKCQLFGAACVRRLGFLVPDLDCLCVATAYERFADSPSTPDELWNAYYTRWQAMDAQPRNRSEISVNLSHWMNFPFDVQRASSLYDAAAAIMAWAKAGKSVERTCAGVSEEERWCWGFTGGPPDEAWQSVFTTEATAHATLLRHIFGNPFRPCPAPNWPPAVVSLAQAVYNGADAGFALHDALLESGFPDLAAHFQEQQWHPKGCWVVDLILSKDR
jgi:hypothetical protein